MHLDNINYSYCSISSYTVQACHNVFVIVSIAKCWTACHIASYMFG